MIFRTGAVSLLVVSCIVVGGCSSCGTAPDGGNANEVNVIVPQRSTNSNMAPNSNGNVKMVPYNGAENLNGDPTRDNSKVVVVNTDNVKPPMKGKPMPGNSELTVIMNPSGHVVETRTFKSDLTVSKLVRVTKSADDVTLKVHLKNGKVYDVPKGKLEDFKTAAIATILKTIGVEPVTDPNASSKANEIEKRMKND